MQYLALFPPLLAAALLASRLVRTDAAVARVAVAACGAAFLAAAGGLLAGGDRLAGSVATAVAAIALLVAGYAARSLHGSSIPYRRFFLTFLLATSASLTVAVATDLRVLAVAWVATGLATSALLASANRPAAHRWARRHLAIEAVGDVAWIAILGLAWRTFGTFDLAALAHVPASAAVTALACALVVAGAARSALVPLHDWLPNSMEAPTPVSAFMHAGLVNGAGVLFAKVAFVLVAAPGALALAATLGAITAATGAVAALVRPESKRRLGWSTVAQMGFMVLQCGCGAFAAAIVHLIAHGGYKSAAFLGVAGSIDAHKAARLVRPAARAANGAAVAALSLGAPTLGIVVAWLAFGPHLALLPAAAAVVALAWATAAAAARATFERALDLPARCGIVVVIAASVVVYLCAVTALDGFVGAALPRVTFAPVADAVAVVAAIAGLIAGSGLRVPASDAAYALALGEARAVPFGPA